MNNDPTSSSAAGPLVYAVVPAYNRCEKTLRFLRSFAEVTYPRKRVVIVDDGSTDGTHHSVELNHPEVPVLQGDGHLWWSGGTNLGVRYALDHGADYILTINDDSVMEPDFLTHLVAVARQDPSYVVGCRLHRQDVRDEIWSIGTSLVLRGGAVFALNFAGRRWSEIVGNLPDPYPVDTMPGNGVLLPRDVFGRVGYYDARNLPQYHADSDLVLRARALGFKPVIALKSVLYNHILEKPLVDNRIDMVLSRKSDRYHRSIRTILKRNAPWGKRTYLLLRQYSPFFFNRGVSGWCKKLLRRILEGSNDGTGPDEIELKFNPTCAGGPSGAGREAEPDLGICNDTPPSCRNTESAIQH
jgi:GT2 family glycosyltransferase